MSRHIYETKDYNKFVLDAFNRATEKHNKNLEKSMQKDGFWDDEPVKVRRKNGKFVIMKGQNRFFVAKKLGLPIKYMVITRKVDIPGEEPTKTPWSLHHYLLSYCKMGKEPYLMVKKYHEETGINLNACISILAGDSAGSGNRANQFKTGIYRLGNLNHSRVIASIINQCRESGYPFWNNSMFVTAASKVCWADGFASEVLKEKIKTFVHFMEKQASVQNYVEMLDSIYNRQSREKTPLAFLAEEAARKRNAVKAGK